MFGEKSIEKDKCAKTDADISVLSLVIHYMSMQVLYVFSIPCS